MPNPHRGEIEACLDGASYRLCLTLRSLAELEHAFGSDDMLALAERFQKGRLSALDAQRIIGAGLRGAGYEILDEAVGRMQAEGGAAGFVDIVARLLSATFGGAAAPIAATVAREMVTSLAQELAGKPDTQPLPQTPPSPLWGGARGGGKLTSTHDEVRTSTDQERSSPFPFPGPT
jgi:hypothetical protein